MEPPVEACYLNSAPSVSPVRAPRTPAPSTSSQQHILQLQINMKRDQLDVPWFYHSLGRRSAEEILLPLAPGTFLCRPSNSSPNCYAMSWKSLQSSAIEHNLIFCQNPGFSLVQQPTNPCDRFWSLSSLVHSCRHFLRLPFVSPEHADALSSSKDADSKTSADVFGAIVDRLVLNDPLLATLSWKLLVLESGPEALHERTLIEYGLQRDLWYLSASLIPISEMSLALLAAAMRRNTVLEQLILSGYSGDDPSSKLPAPLLSGRSRPHHANLTDEDVLLLAEALRENRSLKYLDLSRNRLSERSTSALADALGRHPRIAFIDLEYNCIRAPGIVQFCSTLRPCLSLRLLKAGHQFSLSYSPPRFSNEPNLLRALRVVSACFDRRHELGLGLTRFPSAWFHGFQTAPKATRILTSFSKRPSRGVPPSGFFLCYLDPTVPEALQLAIFSNQIFRLPVKPRVIYQQGEDCLSYITHYSLFSSADGYRLLPWVPIPTLSSLCVWRHLQDCPKCAPFTFSPSSSSSSSCLLLEQAVSFCWKLPSKETFSQLLDTSQDPPFDQLSSTFSTLQSLTVAYLSRLKPVKVPRKS